MGGRERGLSLRRSGGPRPSVSPAREVGRRRQGCRWWTNAMSTIVITRILKASHGGAMDVSNPMSCVVPSAHGPVLAVLAGTTTPLTGRRVAELAQPRVSQPRVARILRELTAAGLVERTPAGSSSLFVLNREHLAAGAVEILATLRQQLWARIAEHARTWSHRPLAVVVYGSAARGDGNIDSDIDLLVVRPMDVDDVGSSSSTSIGRTTSRSMSLSMLPSPRAAEP